MLLTFSAGLEPPLVNPLPPFVKLLVLLLLLLVLRGNVANEMNFGTWDREVSLRYVWVVWDTGEVSGDEGGVSVAILGVDLAVRNFVEPKIPAAVGRPPG